MTTETNTKNPRELIRAMVRGAYDMQKLRIMMGNRITKNFKEKIGVTDDTLTDEEKEKLGKKILKMLKTDYERITDGIISEGDEAVQHKMPRLAKFKPHGIIDNFAELSLVHQYIGMLANEDNSFKNLEYFLRGFPIYETFLKHVDGLGAAMAGVLISEIDISKAEYVSSLWKYAGLDSVTVGVYTDENGKTNYLSFSKVTKLIQENNGSDENLTYKGFPVRMGEVGRSRQEHCLELVEYINKDGEIKTRNSITFNPFLKTKVIGVLSGSFLKAGKTYVDGTNMGAARRLELAISYGFDRKAVPAGEDEKELVIECLRKHGHEIEEAPSKYAVAYYNYKQRIEKMPQHQEKTKLHRHRMALRYAVKRFFADLYVAWRTLENLPVAAEYSEAKLGLVHGVATPAKASMA